MIEAYVVDIVVVLFGAIVGSFLNVCIVRMPQEKSIAFPGSHCVKCQKPLQWYHNIPLLSYLFLRGKCQYCDAKISFRYFFVELLTAGFFLLFYRTFGLDWVLLPYLVMVCGFIVATFVDFEHRIIPDEISVGGMGVGLVLSLFIINLHELEPSMILPGATMMRGLALFFIVVQLIQCALKKKVDKDDVFFIALVGGFYVLEYFSASMYTLGWFVPFNFLSFQASLQGAFLGGGSIYLLGMIGEWIFKKEAMGGGDVKLMAMIGAFLGWKLAILAFFIAPFFGAVIGIISKIRTKESAIAYGPYLCLGALISLFWGDWIILFIMNGYQIP